ncbi:hypothetical protein F5884DRAFT_826816 [Xylogone sp. PMI_703]|nr:hypothetical protein F5884DRAFT_826816 [Xylogone sp. PMI_703]
MSTPSGLLRATSQISPKFSAGPAIAVRLWHPPAYLLAANARHLTSLQTETRDIPEVSFTSSPPRLKPDPKDSKNDPNKPDERTLKLGKTLRILQDRLPTLLQSPLPQDILSPQITLHLFPSTHPHLPTVTGRVAYNAALWTSPIAWGSLPLVGNVKLRILSERMVRCSPARSYAEDASTKIRPEQLIVKWQTVGKGKNKKSKSSSSGSGSSSAKDGDGEFTGLFIFEFDAEGRIVSHTIENVEEGGSWERGVGARVVGLTDWLLGGMRNGQGEHGTPFPVCSGYGGRAWRNGL